MKILFFVPHLNTVYAGRTIYNGYKNAFIKLGHDFRFMTSDDDQPRLLDEFCPDMLFTGLDKYVLKFIDLAAVEKQKKKGMKVFVNTPYWKSPFSKARINEASHLCNNQKVVKLIKSCKYGDVYYNVCEQGDPRMEGFEKRTGYEYYTIPLAADHLMHYPEFSQKFECDISFLGTNLPDKKAFIKENILPLKTKFDIKFFGQDWTIKDRLIGNVARIAKYFNIPMVKDIQRPSLSLDDERKIYTSATISLNIHEEYQRRFGGDCNERTFKIPMCGGFEITDDVACIKKYFKEGKEIVIVVDKQDWFEKIDFYMRNPEKRLPIIKAGRERVLKEHTYVNRVNEFIELYQKLPA